MAQRFRIKRKPRYVSPQPKAAAVDLLSNIDYPPIPNIPGMIREEINSDGVAIRQEWDGEAWVYVDPTTTENNMVFVFVDLEEAQRSSAPVGSMAMITDENGLTRNYMKTTEEGESHWVEMISFGEDPGGRPQPQTYLERVMREGEDIIAGFGEEYDGEIVGGPDHWYVVNRFGLGRRLETNNAAPDLPLTPTVGFHGPLTYDNYPTMWDGRRWEIIGRSYRETSEEEVIEQGSVPVAPLRNPAMGEDSQLNAGELGRDVVYDAPNGDQIEIQQRGQDSNAGDLVFTAGQSVSGDNADGEIVFQQGGWQDPSVRVSMGELVDMVGEIRRHTSHIIAAQADVQKRYVEVVRHESAISKLKTRSERIAYRMGWLIGVAVLLVVLDRILLG